MGGVDEGMKDVTRVEVSASVAAQILLFVFEKSVGERPSGADVSILYVFMFVHM